MELVLQAKRFDPRARGGVELRALTAKAKIDAIHVFHQIKCFLFADMLVKRAAELVGDVVFAVRKRARAAKAVHDRAGLAVNAVFDPDTVDRTVAFFKGIAKLKHGDSEILRFFKKLVSRKNTARPRADNDYVVVHIEIFLYHAQIVKRHTNSIYYTRFFDFCQGLLHLAKKLKKYTLKFDEKSIVCIVVSD